MEQRYHVTTQNRFYPDMSNVNKNITVEAKLISPPTHLISVMDNFVASYLRHCHSIAQVMYGNKVLFGSCWATHNTVCGTNACNLQHNNHLVVHVDKTQYSHSDQVSAQFHKISVTLYISCRSQWPHGLRRRSTATHLLRSWVRIPLGAWMSVCCECCVLSDRGLCDRLITHPGESY